MPVELNHTIVQARDKEATARHLTTLFDLPEHTTYGPFAVVQLANGVSLDIAASTGSTPTVTTSRSSPCPTAAGLAEGPLGRHPIEGREPCSPRRSGRVGAERDERNRTWERSSRPR